MDLHINQLDLVFTDTRVPAAVLIVGYFSCLTYCIIHNYYVSPLDHGILYRLTRIRHI
jgi:hypothetical protein